MSGVWYNYIVTQTTSFKSKSLFKSFFPGKKVWVCKLLFPKPHISPALAQGFRFSTYKQFFIFVSPSKHKASWGQGACLSWRPKYPWPLAQGRCSINIWWTQIALCAITGPGLNCKNINKKCIDDQCWQVHPSCQRDAGQFGLFLFSLSLIYCPWLT